MDSQAIQTGIPFGNPFGDGRTGTSVPGRICPWPEQRFTQRGA